tara:strand:+ start:253 stop:741 length:489 start_codon:yes stop_codon:yes gene_type:complete
LLKPILEILRKRTQKADQKLGQSAKRGWWLASLLLILSLFSEKDMSRVTAAEADWDGEWLAEGTFFRVGVIADKKRLKITQIDSMGQIWSSGEGKIEENIVRIKVEYAGASGAIQAELLDSKTAVVSAYSCQPGYMVVCALSKGRQAIFKKVAGPAASSSND